MRNFSKKTKFIIIAVFSAVLVAAAFFLYDSGDDSIGNQIIVSQAGEGAVTVSWTSESKYDGVLSWEGNEIAAECTEVREGEYYRYEAAVTGLEPDNTYNYRIGSGDVMSKKRTLHYADDQEFSFLYIGDIQYQLRDRDYRIWGEFMQEAYLANEDAAFGIFAGDMVDKAPDVKDWEAFFTNAESVFSQIPMVSTIGNHETSITPSMYLSMMAMPENGPLAEEVYSFDYGDVHFVSLNSCLFMDERQNTDNYQETIEQVNSWIQKDLQSSDARWKIVYMHHPMYPVVRDIEVYDRLQENWEDLFVENGVDLVLCGHQHVYMRTEPVNGITYVMANSGEKRSYYVQEGTVLPHYVDAFYEDGSNYVRVDVTDDCLKIQAYDENGNQIDQCEIK